MRISNIYKNTLNNLIDSLNIESLDKLEQINKGLQNIPKSENCLISHLKEDCLDKDVLNIL